MRSVGGAFLTLMLVASGVCAQTNLDKPIEPQRPTIRTEIYRGRQAGSDCDFPVTYLCILNVQGKNVQQNRATDAFNAGLFFDAWLSSAIEGEAVKSVTGRTAQTPAEPFYKQMKSYQTKLRINNQAFCEAAQVRCENVLPQMNEWDAKYGTH